MNNIFWKIDAIKDNDVEYIKLHLNDNRSISILCKNNSN